MIPPKANLFDLDGTLLDSIEGIVSSFAFTLAKHLPLRSFSRRELIMTIGEPLAVQMRKFAEDDGPLSEAMVQTYRDHNACDATERLEVIQAVLNLALKACENVVAKVSF